MKVLKTRSRRFKFAVSNRRTTNLIIKPQLNPCLGVGLTLHERNEKRYHAAGANSNCCHQFHSPVNAQFTHSFLRHDDWFSESNYKKYTETDSRPTSPIFRNRHYDSRKQNMARKCFTPEPEGLFSSVNTRRVLILDLRKLKSVDIITRQDSVTSTATVSLADGAEDEDHFHKISAKRSSGTGMSPLRRKQKTSQVYKLRPFPVAYERSSSPKILETMTFPPLHSSVLTLLSQGSISGTKNGTDEGSATKQKKLRRQGRRQKSESHENVDADEDKKPRDNVEENIAKKLCGDKTHERGAASSELENMKNNFEEKYDRQLIISPKMQTSKSTLYQILDERLSKRSWYLSEGQLNREIADLEKLVGKTEKTLRTLNLNEDLTQLLTAKEPKKHLC